MGLGALEVQLIQLLVHLRALLIADARAGAALGLQLDNGAVRRGAQLQLGGLIQLLGNAPDPLLGRGGQSDRGILQQGIIENDAAVADKAVRLQHTGKGLGKDRLAGAGLAHNGDGLILVNVQINAANGSQNSAADVEFDLQVLHRQ